MAEIKFDVVTNAKKVAKELDAVARSARGIGKDAKDSGDKAKGMGGAISKAFTPLAVGGMVALGIKAIGDDIKTMNDNATQTIRTLKEINFLRGEAGKKIVRDLSTSLGEDIEVIKDVAGPIFSANAGRSDAELKSLIANAIFEKKSSGADATTVAMGTSGLLNASDTFSKPGGAGAVGAQNLLVGTVKSANMNVGEIGILGPLFPAAAAAGASPSEAAAAFSMVTSSGVPAAQAVTQVIALLFAWRKNGGGMGLTQFIQYALAIDDPKKQFEMLTETGFKAASVLAGDTAGFGSLSKSLQAQGQSTVSSSEIRLKEQIASGELTGEQLSTRIASIDRNVGSDKETSESMAVGGAVRSIIGDAVLAYLKTAAAASPLGVAEEVLSGGFLLESAGLNVEKAEKKIGAINNRKMAVSLESVSLTQKKVSQNNNQNSPIRK